MKLSYSVTAVSSWLLLWHCVLSADTSGETPNCMTLFTFGYGYRQFFHMSPSNTHQANGDLLFMKFMVKARSDAHILLSPTPSPEEADPVYEIVLGAGRNSFSDIRRKRRAATKSSAYTKDILSGTELKGFWVKMNAEGLIQVGSEGEDLPFMQWQDPEPLHIQYYSFCTWSGVAGKWLYDCSVTDDTASVAVQPTLTATERLRQALLTNYDVYSRPVTDSSQLMQINIKIQANHVHLDAKKSVMTVGSVFTLMWYDEKMVWHPENFNNLSMLHLFHHEIWQPELIHFNAVGKGVSPLGEAGMQVRWDGHVRWSPRSLLHSRCRQNLRQWPWDTQTCSIQLGFWNQPNTLQLMLLENGTKLELQKTSSEWVVLKLDAESIIIRTPWLTDLTAFSSDDSDDADMPNPTALTFTFTLKRVNVGYYYILVIPLIVLIVMSLTCFWMDPVGKEKLATNCLLLVLLCQFLLSLESSLPAPTDHTPYLFKAYSWVMVVVASATVVTVIIVSIMNTSHHRPPPRLVCMALTSQFIGSLFCLPKSKSKTPNYAQLSERSDYLSLVVDPVECDSAANCSWSLLAVFCDRLVFIAAIIAYTVLLAC